MSELSWEDLTKYDDNPPEDKALPRSTSVQKRYGGYLGALKRKGSPLGKMLWIESLKTIMNNK